MFVLVLFHPDFEGVTEVDIDPKGRFVFLKITPSNERVLCGQGVFIGSTTKGYGQ